jgi:hypothetical protein
VIHGSVEALPSGGPLTYAGPDPQHVVDLVEGMSRWYDRGGILHELTDQELV